MQSIDWDVFQRRWFPIFWQRRRLFWGEEFGCKREKKSRTRPENQSHSIEKILSRCRPPLSLSFPLSLSLTHTHTHPHTRTFHKNALRLPHTHTYTNHTLSYLHSPHSNTCTEFLYLFSSHSLTHTRTPYWHAHTHIHAQRWCPDLPCKPIFSPQSLIIRPQEKIIGWFPHSEKLHTWQDFQFERFLSARADVQCTKFG